MTPQRHLSPRFTPALALASAAILLAAGLVVSVYQDRMFRAQHLREVTAQAEILAASVTAALTFDDAKAVQEYVSAFGINPEIEAVGVYDERSALVAGLSRNGEKLPSQLGSPPLLPVIRGRTAIVVPVKQNGDTLGTIHIRSIDEPDDRRLTRYVPIMLLAGMAALLITLTATTQRSLRKANAQLEVRAVALADANRLLQIEIEERGKAEEALRQSQKMEAIGQLAGGVAHDFNNLLTIIHGNLHILRFGLAEGRTDVESYLDAANEAVDRAASLTRRLLGFSRRQTISPVVCDLNELAVGMKGLIEHSVGSRIVILWDLGAQWRAICDVNQMENVMLNLAINARDAMADGGTLTIVTRDTALDPRRALMYGLEPGDHVELRVSDTGAGMTDEVRVRAVDPFFTTKPQGQGTGLGLSMAFAFIRQLNGRLTIESEPGRGTAIVILLPRAPGNESQGGS